jgi:hypothetical protein
MNPTMGLEVHMSVQGKTLACALNLKRKMTVGGWLREGGGGMDINDTRVAFGGVQKFFFLFCRIPRTVWRSITKRTTDLPPWGGRTLGNGGGGGGGGAVKIWSGRKKKQKNVEMTELTSRRSCEPGTLTS